MARATVAVVLLVLVVVAESEAAAPTCPDPNVGYDVTFHKPSRYKLNTKITFSCTTPNGYKLHAVQKTATCEGNKTSVAWSFDMTVNPPYCRAVSCPTFPSQNLIPFGLINQTKQGVNDTSHTNEQLYSILGAVVTYVCNSPAQIQGIATRTCLSDGTWSNGGSKIPYCDVPAQSCSACQFSKKPIAGETTCCSLNKVQPIGCCSPAVKQTLNDRFAGVPKTCASDMQNELSPCAGGILTCMNAGQEQKDRLNCQDTPIFGCFRNQLLPDELGNNLAGNCSAYAATPDTISCVAETKLTLTGKTLPRGFCLPKNCQTSDSLKALANSTMKLFCDNDLLVAKRGFCLASSINITCSDKSKASYTPPYPVTCASGCHSKEHPGWSECCSLDTSSIGCCSPLTKDLLDNRFSTIDSASKCRSAMKGLLSPCLPQLVQCYSDQHAVTNTNCPNLHGCSVPIQSNTTCADFAGNNSVSCTKTCPGSSNCHQETFCLPKDCANKASLMEIANGDAQISCSMWKTSGIQYCQWVNVTITCDGGLSVSAAFDDRAKTCPAPALPTNGFFNVTKSPGATKKYAYPPGSQVTYWCIPGYAPTTVFNVITCGDDGKWDKKGPNCTAVSCGPPVTTNDTNGVIVTGNHFSYGSKVTFSCRHEGFIPIPASSICQSDKTWDYTVLPYCIAAKCPELFSYYGMNNNNGIPYGRVTMLKMGVNDSVNLAGESAHLYGATIKYTCDKPATASGPASLTCQLDGTWSSSPPVCTVSSLACNSSEDCQSVAGHPDFTSCCAYGSTASGVACCPKTTKSVVDARFSGLTSQCRNDLTAAYGLCADQVVDCFNQNGRGGCSLLVQRFYMYGCNSGVPPPPAPQLSPNLDMFCRTYGPPKSIPCIETRTTVTNEHIAGNPGICLPASCGTEMESLHAVAAASLKTYCAADSNPLFCSTASVTLSCNNGTSAEASGTASCDNCPKDASECCEIANYTLGCCSKSVKKMVEERFMQTSVNCTAALAGRLKLCGIAIVSCLNNIGSNGRLSDCPNMHACMNWIGVEFCPSDNLFGDELGAAPVSYCSSTCTGNKDCFDDTYCLPAACMNQADVKAITAQDANITCDFYKQVNSVTTCDVLTVNTECYGAGGNISASYKVSDKGKINVTKCDAPFIPDFGGIVPNVSVFISGLSITYYCDSDYRFAPQAKYGNYFVNITCLSNGGWNANGPDCVPVNCPDLLGQLDGGKFPYGSVALQKQGATGKGVCDGTAKKPCTHTAGAVLKYTCEKGTTVMGNATRTCQMDGTWSGDSVLCPVLAAPCSTDPKNKLACSGKTPVCIALPPDPTTGPMCGTQTVKEVVDQRFAGITGQCRTDFMNEFAPCITQIIDCLNRLTAEGSAECVELIAKFYEYGCNNKQPPPMQNSTITQMRQYCATASISKQPLTCLESGYKIDATHDRPVHFCLPVSCIGQLDAVAMTTRALRCSLEDYSVCSIETIQLQCQNSTTLETHSGTGELDTTCGKCPHAGQDASYTECCQLSDTSFGCCPRNVSDLMAARFAGLSVKCLGAMGDAFLQCRAALLQCLSTGLINDPEGLFYNCPSLHGCAANALGAATNCVPFTGFNSSYCISGSVTDINGYGSDKFCLPGPCTNVADIQAFTASEANVACQLAKAAKGKQFCGSAEANMTCQANSAPHTKFIEGASFSDTGSSPTGSSPTPPPGSSSSGKPTGSHATGSGPTPAPGSSSSGRPTGSGPTAAPGSSSSGKPTAAPVPKPKSKTSAGVVVGGILGAIFAVVLSIVVYLVYRRRYKAKSMRYKELSVQEQENDGHED